MNRPFEREGVKFDCINPLITMFLNWKYRPSVTHIIRIEDSWVVEELRHKNIKTWGLTIRQEYALFSTRKQQEMYTQYWLTKWGIYRR